MNGMAAVCQLLPFASLQHLLVSAMSSVPRFLATAARQARPAARYTAPTASLQRQRRGNATAVDPPRQKAWTREEIQEIYDTPLMDLIFQAVRL
jgi:biotin synthase